MGRRSRSFAWQDESLKDESPIFGPQSPPQVTGKTLLSLDSRTPGGQAMMKRNKRSFTFGIDDAANQKENDIALYDAFEKATLSNTPFEQASTGAPASRLYKRDQAVSDGALYKREQCIRISDIAFLLADIDDDDDDEDMTPANEVVKEDLLPENTPVDTVRSQCVYDIVANENGELELLPVGDQPEAVNRKVSDLHQEEVVAIRVFRFLEDRDDEKHPWEQALHNVNTGSLLWLLVQMLPKMHSVSGAKYGKWFTVHTVSVHAKHFKSNYHMFKEGNAGPAKTFGTSTVTRNLVTGQKLAKGYFWFCSPVEGSAEAPSKDVTSQEHFEAKGWQHLGREGPFDGEHFVEEWRKQGEAMDEDSLQQILEEWML